MGSSTPSNMGDFFLLPWGPMDFDHEIKGISAVFPPSLCHKSSNRRSLAPLFHLALSLLPSHKNCLRCYTYTHAYIYKYIYMYTVCIYIYVYRKIPSPAAHFFLHIASDLICRAKSGHRVIYIQKNIYI